MASRSGRLRRAPALLLLLAAVALLVAHAARYRTITVDDAAISFTYARNLAQGHGLVLTPGGERVEAFSDPAWVGLLALFELAGLPVEQGAKTLGLLCSLAALLLLVPLAARLRGAGAEGRGGPGATLETSRAAVQPGSTGPESTVRQDRALIEVLIDPLADPLPGAAALVAATSVSLALWSVAGLESGLHAFLLMLLAWRLLAEDRRPAMFPGSALVLLGLLLTRPEAPLTVAVACAYKLRLLLRGPGRRHGGGAPLPAGARAAAVRWLLLLVVPAALLLLARWLYFGAWLPNSFHIKQISFSFDPLAPLRLDAAGWRYLAGFVRANELWPLLALVPLGLLGPARGRAAWLLALALLAAGLYFPLYSGGDWMPEHRFLAPLVPLLALLAAAGPAALAGQGERWALSRGRPRLAVALRWAAALLLLAAAAPHALRFARGEAPPAPSRFTTFDEVCGRAEAFTGLARRLELPQASLLDPDLGGTSWTAGLKAFDLFGLADRMLSRYRWQAPLVREYLLGELRPTFIHLHGAWLSAYHLQDYPEIPHSYFLLPARLPDAGPAPGGLNLVRRSLFVQPWAPLQPRRETAFAGAGLRLVDVDTGPAAAAPGSTALVRLTFLVERPPRREPEAVLLFAAGEGAVPLAPLAAGEAGPTSSPAGAGEDQGANPNPAVRGVAQLGGGLFPAAQWQPGERIVLQLRPSLPATARGRYTLLLRLHDGPGGRVLPASDGRTLVPLGELEVEAAAARAGKSTMLDAFRTGLAAGRLDRARVALERLQAFAGAADPDAARACDALAAALLTRVLLLAAADDLETAARTLQAALALGSGLPSGERLRAGLAARLHRAGAAALAAGDADGAFTLLRAALDLEPARSSSRTLLEEARGRRSAADAPFLALQAHRAALAYGLAPSPERQAEVLHALAEAGGRLDEELISFCPPESCAMALAAPERLLLARAFRRQGLLDEALLLLRDGEEGSREQELERGLLRQDLLSLLGQQPMPGEVRRLLAALPDPCSRDAGPDLQLRGFDWSLDRDERVVLRPFFHRSGARVASSRGLVQVEARPAASNPAGTVRQARALYLPGGRVFALALPLRLPRGAWRVSVTLPGAAMQPVELGEVVVDSPNLTFESGTLAGWQAEGDAFAGLPLADGPLPGQQLVTGWRGRWFVNGFARGDRARGKLTSSPFRLDGPRLGFLVGGGRQPGQLAVRLLVGGRAVREATGTGSERMSRVVWDVTPWQGQQARIELTDQAVGSWGHLLFDDVQHLPAAPGLGGEDGGGEGSAGETAGTPPGAEGGAGGTDGGG